MLRRRLMQSGIPDGFVDLGLPSGLLWAQGNIVKDGNTYSIGAPTDYGCYFSWGNIDGYNEGEYGFEKYQYNYTPGYSVTANIASNDASHDAALACLGEGWHMPSIDNFEELLKYCDMIDANGNVLRAAGYNGGYITGGTYTTTYNGVEGLLLRSTINGKLLFFPGAGTISQGRFIDVGYSGYYWSSSYHANDSARYMNFDTSNVTVWTEMNRYSGLSVRGVFG